MRRRTLAILSVALLLGACSRPAPPPPAAPSANPEVSVPAPPEPAGPVQPYDFTAYVSNSPEGPWSDYRVGMTLAEGPLWLRLTADRPLPADAVSRLTQYLVTPEGASVQLQNKATVIIGVRDQPVLWVNAEHMNDETTPVEQYVIFGGAPARLVEVAPESGAATSVAVLEPPPRDLPDFAIQDGLLTYQPLRHIPGFMQVDLKTGNITPTGSMPAHPAPAGPARTHGSTGSGTWVESPSPDNRLVARLDASRSEPGSPVALVVTERSTGKVVAQNESWIGFDPGHPCFTLGIDHAWSPDGKYLAALSRLGDDQVELAVLEIATGSTKRMARQAAGDSAYQASVSWSPDGSTILFRHSLVEAATGHIRSDSVLYQNKWRSDGRYLLSAEPNIFRGYGTVRLIDTASGRVIYEADGAAVGWTPTGTVLVVEWPNGNHVPISPRECY